jgi:glycosyltransferase involved in cell wall biosynthesis
MKLTIIVPMYNNEDRILRCLESIERRKDVEIIIIDDFSKDKTYEIAKTWVRKNRRYFGGLFLLKNEENLGVGLTMNRGYDLTQGQYVMTLCDDDYLIEPLSTIIKEIDGSDLIYYNLRINDGTIWVLDDSTKRHWVGATKLYKSSIIGNTRRKKKRLYGDGDFYFEILKKNPKEKFTNIIFYHYDFPRKGSLVDEAINKNKKKEG